MDLQSNALTVGSLVMNGTSPAITNSTGTSSLTVSGTSTLANAITTSGAQTYTGAVTLGASTTLTSTSSGNLSFDSTVSGAYSLTTSTGGNTTFSGEVGSTPLTGLTITTAQLSAGAITLATTGTPALSITNSAAGSITGIISGTNASLTKAGVGTLTLSGTNTYGGVTTVNGGTLSISADANLGAVPSVITPASIVLDGGTIQATESFTLHSYRGITLGSSGGGLAATAGDELTYGGVVGGTYTLTINGAGQTGQVTLMGSNTYSATTITAGTLQIGDGGTNGTLGSAAVANNGMLVFKRTDAITVSQVITGTGGVRVIGTDSGSLTLSSGSSTYGGATTVISGTLVAGASTTASVTSGPFGTGAVTVSSGAALDLNGQSIANALKLNGAGISNAGALINTNINTGTQTGDVVLQSATSVGVGAGKALTLSTGVVSGSFALTVNAGAGQTGTVLLSGANIYGGATTVNGGTLVLTSTGTLGNTSSLLTLSGATLDLRTNCL